MTQQQLISILEKEEVGYTALKNTVKVNNLTFIGNEELRLRFSDKDLDLTVRVDSVEILSTDTFKVLSVSSNATSCSVVV